MPIDKSKWDRSLPVPQEVINSIKKMGMTQALKTVAGSSAASDQDPTAKVWTEGVKRLYGANRVATAVANTPVVGGAPKTPIKRTSTVTSRTSKNSRSA